jgi:glycosyltransferase involved in cell wall biosynthesis
MADVLLMISDPYAQRFGGIGSVSIESFACGTPVISPNLVHFEGSLEELKQIGVVPKSMDISDIENSVKEVLNNRERFNKCRSIVQKYYDAEVTLDRTEKIYRSLFKKTLRNYQK